MYGINGKCINIQTTKNMTPQKIEEDIASAFNKTDLKHPQKTRYEMF